MKLLILLFTLGTGLAMWHSVSSYRATVRDAKRYEAAKRHDVWLRQRCVERHEQATDDEERDAASDWLSYELMERPFQGGRPVGKVVGGSWAQPWPGPEASAADSLPQKRKESLLTGIGGLCGMMAGLLGLLL